MPLVRVVHPVHEVGRPPGVGFHAHDAEVGVALEHAAVAGGDQRALHSLYEQTYRIVFVR